MSPLLLLTIDILSPGPSFIPSLRSTWSRNNIKSRGGTELNSIALQARVQALSCRSPVAQPIVMVYCRSPIRPATLALQAACPRCRSFLVLSLVCVFQTTSFGNSFHLSLEVGKRSVPDKLLVPV